MPITPGSVDIEVSNVVWDREFWEESTVTMLHKLTKIFSEDKTHVAKKRSVFVEKIVKLLESYANLTAGQNRKNTEMNRSD